MPVPKSSKKKGGGDGKLIHTAQHKVQTGFLPGTRGHGFQLPGVKLLPGML